MSDEYNLNTAEEQRSLDVIPTGTICALQLTIRSGGAGDGWLKTAKNGIAEGLDCEFIVVDGPFANRKLWQFLILKGNTPGHAQAGKISRSKLRAILESARGIRPDDNSEAAQKARQVSNWGDLNNLRFVARLGVEPPSNGYAAKNSITEVFTPERHAWKQVEQIRDNTSNGTTAASAPANSIARPEWAKD
jgi:hypothetical protein